MELLNKAKSIFDTATTKTEEFIYDQKCNLQIARVCADLKKAYEKLGRLCYRKLNNIKVDDNEFDAAVEKVSVLKAELAALREGKESVQDFKTVVFEDGEPIETDSSVGE